MVRFLAGLGILAICLAVGLWTSTVMDTRHQAICDTLNQAAGESTAGDLETGISLARSAQDQWERHWHGSAVMADHAPMDEIDSLFAQLQVYGQAGLATDFASYCTRLAKLVAAMGEAHALTWWNLL